MPRALLLAVAALAAAARPAAAEPEALFDWSDAGKFRAGDVHPSGAFKPSDVVRAREVQPTHRPGRRASTGLLSAMGASPLAV